MKKWWWGLVLFLLVAGIGGYQLSGYGHWARAQARIAQLSESEQGEAWRELEARDPLMMEGGILAWVGQERVWVWGRGGLKQYRVDEHSIYSWFDGCNAEVLEELNAGVAGAITRMLYSEIDDWRSVARAGDYVRVVLANERMGGTVGNLREIYDYNFWLFLPTGMEERCAK
jgi:hypothetical protein